MAINTIILVTSAFQLSTSHNTIRTKTKREETRKINIITKDFSVTTQSINDRKPKRIAIGDTRAIHISCRRRSHKDRNRKHNDQKNSDEFLTVYFQ
ncbi:hypothetical protein KL86CLO1_11115 [uncultured Eubacteriales bacterium]|uniref:Uncharacterized protein n=1 Tax=uncultured Eubacteriales bacterium TaxID=172733 RepID=A0A212JHU3_9FIRM|nr:hypothetical protein KL86CLO1_11115 [uncultured Eubacteriales bacterium]